MLSLSYENHAGLGVGVGLRPCHYDWVLSRRPKIAWFEIISENFMIPGGKAPWILDRVRADYPIAMHGVSASLGSKDPVPADYLQKLKDLVNRLDPLWVSDHLCWTGIAGRNSHDLWPLPYTAEAMHQVVHQIQRIQDFLGRQILIENVSTYVEFCHSEMAEWDFLTEVVKAADCGILLDINNIYVNAHNHGFDPYHYLRSIPYERVFEIHLAGPSQRGKLLVDTHDHPVTAQAWKLYEYFLEQAGARPTLVEWDENIPEFPELHREAQKAQQRIDKINKSNGSRSKDNTRTVLAAHPST